MRSIQYERIADPGDVLTLVDCERPVPGPGEVLVRPEGKLHQSCRADEVRVGVMAITAAGHCVTNLDRLWI